MLHSYMPFDPQRMTDPKLRKIAREMQVAFPDA
jgi:hypothetical protein